MDLSTDDKKELRLKAKLSGKKFCNNCLETKEFNEFYRKQLSLKTGIYIYQSVCKICTIKRITKDYYKKSEGIVKKRFKHRLNRNKKSLDGKKICNKCDETKDLINFYTCGKTKNGNIKYAYICRKCSDKDRAYRRKLKSDKEKEKRKKEMV